MKLSIFLMSLILLVLIPFGTLAAIIHVPTDQPTIQAGIDAAVDGDTVLVADGTYVGANNRNLDYYGRAIALTSENGADNCIIDCEQQSCTVSFEENESNLSIFNGFTVKNGESIFGAIRCYEASPTISGCVFVSCHSSDHGGAIYLYESKAKILNCKFINNNSTHSAGAVYIYHNSQPYVSNCLMSGNYAIDTGGAIWCEFSGGVIIDCLIVENHSEMGGGGITVHDGNLQIQNCTIANNMSSDSGGALKTDSTQIITNCIIWGNIPNSISSDSGEPPVVTYSDVQGAYPNKGNINKDPIFIGGDPLDYHLSPDSPCIDAGTDDGAPSTDLDRNPRLRGGSVDMGAYEFSGWPSITRAYIKMPSHIFKEGDTAFCAASVWNPYDYSLDHNKLFVILDIYDQIFMAPSFSDFDYYTWSFNPGRTELIILPEFSWPDVGSASGLVWYAALTNPEMTELASEIGVFDFGWGE